MTATLPEPPVGPVGSAAVLLVNLGTPDAPTPAAVRRYLAEFLSDRRVVDTPRWLWWPILHGVILRVRPRRSAHAYATVWTSQGSPLRTFSEALAGALEAALQAASGGRIRAALAMRYGQPSVGATIDRLLAAGVRRLLVLPLYPQYSATSTGSVIDAVAAALQRLRWPPELCLVNDYHDDAGYIGALARSVRDEWDRNGRAQKLLLSFHGIPQRYVASGDPYLVQCRVTAERLRAALDLEAAAFAATFQSRVGREPWLQPYTDETLRRLPADGVRRIQVLCPGFAVDCLETLEEIAERGRADFLAAGGERLDYIPALNASADHVDVLRDIVRRNCAGWPEAERLAGAAPQP